MNVCVISQKNHEMNGSPQDKPSPADLRKPPHGGFPNARPAPTFQDFENLRFRETTDTAGKIVEVVKVHEFHGPNS